MAKPIRTLIMGAAGRDFHNFNTYFRDNEAYRVVAFTATQIPDIEGRCYPASLAGRLYPEGIPIHAEEKLVDLIADLKVEQVIFAYSDVSHVYVMHKAATAMAAGADFRLLGPEHTMVKSTLPVVAVTAVRTGVGKSQTTRKVADTFKKAGIKVAVIRHPMPYGDLEAQAVQRFATLEDLDKHHCTIEEREEYAPHIEAGHLVFAGVDYERILRAAEKEAEVILWDGGNNDYPFYKPDLMFALVDPHRLGHETTYFPGEVCLRMGDVIIINKVDSAPEGAVATLRKTISEVNPKAIVVEAASTITVENPEVIKGKKVLVVEDGPTLTHGEMGFGAGLLAARQHNVTEIIDPRPYAKGTIKGVFDKWATLGIVLPAMGYSAEQCRELEETIAATPAEAVVIGTPIDLSLVVKIDKPSVRVRYDLDEKTSPNVEQLLAPIIEKVRPRQTVG